MHLAYWTEFHFPHGTMGVGMQGVMCSTPMGGTEPEKCCQGGFYDCNVTECWHLPYQTGKTVHVYPKLNIEQGNVPPMVLYPSIVASLNKHAFKTILFRNTVKGLTAADLFLPIFQRKTPFSRYATKSYI